MTITIRTDGFSGQSDAHKSTPLLCVYFTDLPKSDCFSFDQARVYDDFAKGFSLQTFLHY